MKAFLSSRHGRISDLHPFDKRHDPDLDAIRNSAQFKKVVNSRH